jgi:hypothetical protein
MTGLLRLEIGHKGTLNNGYMPVQIDDKKVLVRRQVAMAFGQRLACGSNRETCASILTDSLAISKMGICFSETIRAICKETPEEKIRRVTKKRKSLILQIDKLKCALDRLIAEDDNPKKLLLPQLLQASRVRIVSAQI